MVKVSEWRVNGRGFGHGGGTVILFIHYLGLGLQ